MTKYWNEMIQHRLQSFAEAGLKRELRPVRQVCQPVLVYQGKQLLNFSSNNYLGLAGHPEIIAAEKEAAERGAGGVASRLIIGHDEAIEELEYELARFQDKEAALVFANGYMANVGILSAFLGRHDAVFSDRLNHASIVDGIRLSGAVHYRYHHGDLNHLELQLKKAEQKGIKRRLIVTDSVFSMDGDVAPLKEIIFLKEKYGAALMIDEAHAGGVFGEEGQGMAHQLGIHGQVDLHMGTFSKAFGVYGAYIAGKKEWIQYLVHTCRSLIYTTALPPTVVGGIRKALKLVQNGNELRQMLAEKSQYVRRELREAGLDIGSSSTQIIPIVLGDERTTLAFSEKLLACGILSVAIRPPTVPKGSARIRLSIMANHEWDDLRKAVHVIKEIAKELEVI
ncbi:8-amino-7-oxononanoate synthase [Thermoflavimicrobium dichotomicum]|uniref:8-amino-7-ketopelargonate synthase n=1 Tax=Thermoflavimicrobium dichotomicum TaxID=46223 RepID=A0A1I3PYU8_9BACL|nr:8-amino-7-oxononanoate synthase [Thermoflavimicrobium dichotomicum]SFJ26391.1 8-amino-7-oxononanoate synthase [Thermoflavimicrobium dichotomicum]